MQSDDAGINKNMKILQNRSYPDNISCNIGFEKSLNQEQISRLNWVIEQQTQKQRDTFYKFFRDNMTVKENSAEDGVTRSCVRSRISTTIIHLRWASNYILTGETEA